MKKKQVRNLVVALGLVAAIGGGATLALLTAQSETVTNTFTVGKNLNDDDITLDEAQVDPDTGKAVDPEVRVQENTYKNLEQGAELDKDPTVTIAADAADCYVFVEITGINDTYYDVTIEESWKKVDGKDFYVYCGNEADPAIVSGGLQGKNGLVFDGVTIKDNAPLYVGDESAELPEIIVKACAVQATNQTYADVLDAVTFAE